MAWRASTDLGASAEASGFTLSCRAALWARDLGKARANLAGLIQAGVHGPAIDATTVALQAGIDALEGRTAEATNGYRTAMAVWRAQDLPWDEALTALDMAHVLDPASPDVQAAATAAREILVRIGAKPFLAQLDALVPPGEGAAASERPAGDATTTEDSLPAGAR